MESKNNKIKTCLKFKRSKLNQSLIGFVTKQGQSWRGCRENENVNKKIVIADYQISKSMLPEILYKVTLVPMTTDKGFIAINATEIKFEAFVTIVKNNGVYEVIVSFGNKNIVFSPMSNNGKSNDYGKVLKVLANRIDIKDLEIVISDFAQAALEVKKLNEKVYGGHC